MSGSSTAFEIYILKKGQWRLHGRHNASDRDSAIEEAKQLEHNKRVDAVRVVREIYDAETNSTEEYIVYKGGKAAGADSSSGDPPSVSAKIDGEDRGDNRFIAAPQATNDVSEASPTVTAPPPTMADRRPNQPRPKTVSRGLIRLTLIIAAAVIVAGLVTGVAAVALGEVPELRNVLGFEDRGDQAVLFFIFLITFIISLVASTLKQLPLLTAENRIAARSTQNEAPPDGFAASERQEWSQAIGMIDSAETERKKRASEAIKRAHEAGKETSGAELEVESLDDILAAAETKAVGIPPPAIALSPAAEAHQATIMNFLSKGLETIITTQPRLDSYNKLGISLYLAGACDAAGQIEGVTPRDTAAILSQGVQILGNDAGQAEKFAREVERYLMEPRYLDMIESGRDAMLAHLEDTPDAPLRLKGSLEQWNSHKGHAAESGGTIALMFTDIVGSTDLTQAYGDAAAQDVVRLHNRVVRAALTAHQGREIKHLGDGIMAAFGNTTDAVAAAIRIQRRIVVENQSAEVPFDIKIGINAGEPVVEDDDLFGATVQLAARIVDAASARQIFVSEVVRGICTGKDFTFEDRGDRPLKGFKEPVPIYELLWKTAAATTQKRTVAPAEQPHPITPPATPEPIGALPEAT